MPGRTVWPFRSSGHRVGQTEGGITAERAGVLAVTAGWVLFGVADAVIAVPLVAVARSVGDALRQHGPAGPRTEPGEPTEPGTEPDCAGTAATGPDPR